MKKKSKYRGYYADCYVLSNKRKLNDVNNFLDTFIPNRTESAVDYSVPLHSLHPTTFFNTAAELITYLSENGTIENTVYWSNNEKTELKGAMCFFTNDNNVIYGLYCDTKYEDTSIEDFWLEKMKNYLMSDVALIEYETPAPHNSEEFIDLIKNRSK